MVNKYFWMPVFAAAAVLAGCAKQEPSLNEKEALQIPGEENVELEEVTINVQAPDSRTYLSEGVVRWSKNDRVSIFDSANLRAQSSAVAEAGVSATLTASITKGSTPLYALYPHDGSASISGGLITTTLTREQEAPNVSSFGKCNVVVGKLASDGLGGYNCEMKNVCGYLKFTLPKHGSQKRKSDPEDNKDYSSTHVKKVTVTTTAGNLTGDITINYNDGTPEITNVANGNKTIDFTPKSYTKKDSEDLFYLSGDYYLVVLPGDYTGITVTLEYDDETPSYTRTSTGSFSVSRGQYTDLGIFADDVVILDFSNGNDQLYQDGDPKKYLPTAGRKNAGVEDVWKLDQNSRTYTFGITTWENATGGNYNGSSYCYYPSNNALMFVKQAQVMRLPISAGKALAFIRALHGNSASKTDTKNFRLCINSGSYNDGTKAFTDPTSKKEIKMVYWNPTERGGVDQSAYTWTFYDNLVKDGQWYIQPRGGSSNICIRRLELYYYKQD